ncbi:MAG TPA: hypothetical protein VJU61_15075 [Polyangiaceae bacterium]|nr:hypothetical protein [Polyangiaceae bacterium]
MNVSRWMWGALCGGLFIAAAGAACSDDESEAGACVAGGGPVASSAGDTHCLDSAGQDIIQPIGACATGAAASDDHEHPEEQLGIFYGRAASDDACKYEVSFTNTCITLNQPVTFTVALKRKGDGTPASGAAPANPEIYMVDEPHVSPSNGITAPERSPGVYDIGPIVFDRAGRWVVRFHFFETCSDLLEDSPHGHVAFYIDVP